MMDKNKLQHDDPTSQDRAAPAAVSAMDEAPVSPLNEHAPAESTTQDDRRTLEANTNDAAMTHPPFSGTHSHPHAHADGSQASESHTHNEDNHHEHADYQPENIAHPRALSAVSPFNMYLPITRSDATERMVFGQATIEQPDAYGTIFGYYPEGWKKWRGNVREQHDPKKAVGRALRVEEDAQERAIYVGSKISRGAQDTWLKVEDGVLSGYSASIIPDSEYGNDISKWPKKEYNGKKYPYLPRYSVVELSLVDNPATPGCNISIVRANGMATDVLDFTEEIPVPAPLPVVVPPAQPMQRAGARLSADTQAAMHSARDFTMQAARKMLDNCGCDECGKLAKFLDPDMDGDIDAPGTSLGTDQDAIKNNVARALQPAFMRLQAIAGDFSRRNTTFNTSIDALNTKLDGIVSALERVADTTSLDAVRAELSAVKGQVAVIAAQPQAGGPVMNGQTINKSLPNSPYYQPYSSDQAVLDRLAASGAFDTLDKQIAAAALAVRPMYGNQK